MEWSAYFELASDQALAELSGCELAFAVPDQVRAVIPSNRIAESPPSHAVLVEPDGRMRPVPVVRPEPAWNVLEDPKQADSLRPWIVQFEGTLHAVLSSSPSLSPPASGSDVHERAEALRARLRDAAPAGGKWAKSLGGCGSIQFGDGSMDNLHGTAVKCGMGFLPEHSRRFLWLYCERKS